MPLQPFNAHKPVRIYFTNLPHWRQEGCTYFVTYRLADSIPLSVLAQWESEKLDWLRHHDVHTSKWTDGFPQLPSDLQGAFMKHFNRKLNSYLDEGHGACLLRQPVHQKVVSTGWQYFHGQRYELSDLVIMPNHVHLLLTPLPGHELEDILQSRKRQSAKEINHLSQRKGDLWQKHSYDHIVRDETELTAFQRYIADNPMRASLKAGDYLLRT
ncbi:MAG: transposase [Verrucomicrobiaceae bacterium]|nr:transposase [Verrucomicrobiaceae bacterium]